MGPIMPMGGIPCGGGIGGGIPKPGPIPGPGDDGPVGSPMASARQLAAAEKKTREKASLLFLFSFCVRRVPGLQTHLHPELHTHAKDSRGMGALLQGSNGSLT